jgi:4-alpha-glucanotransferase
VYYGAQVTSLQSRRSSGILLHPTSLPGPFAVGDFGEQARAFVDFLAAAGQTLWQVLPLGPTGLGNSPYQSCSAFAGSTLFIDPRQLVGDDLLEENDFANENFREDHVDYDRAAHLKTRLLDKAFRNFKAQSAHPLRPQFEFFCAEVSWWLDDYALYQSLKEAHGGRNWSDWDQDLVLRRPTALMNARNTLREQIEGHKLFQFLLFRQWQSLREYAREHKVKIVGDLPIFVAYDSVDVWMHREYFKLDGAGKPTVVAGVPPDYFSETGQLWGNPLYDWETMQGDNFRWWIDRMRWSLSLFDLVRVDHFRGFAACWEVPAGSTTAASGHWANTLGRELFAAVKSALGDLPIVAEDLGDITDDVNALRDSLGFPGMRVMQFGFVSDLNNIHLPHNYSRNVVAYTGTHDSNTTVGWFAQLRNGEREFCRQYLHSDGHEINWVCMAAMLASEADVAITPLQDVLGLGSEARMNIPSSSIGNWVWRYDRRLLSEGICERLRYLTELHARN